jgi:2-succinyl-6-hydroxy-2,4-cyclohexadiene-1-carboxylate synthase
VVAVPVDGTVTPPPVAESDSVPSAAPGAVPSSCGGSGIPLLVGVHGWMLSGRLWQPLVEALPASLEMWCPDLPGFGAEPRPRGLHPSLASYGRWLAAAVRERAAGRPVILIGHSLGGSLALHAAPLLGEQLCGVVQIAVGGGVYQPRPFALVRRGGAAFLRFRPGWLAHLPGTGAIAAPLRAEERAARGLLAASTCRRAVQQLPCLTAELTVPSLWITGTRDTVMEPGYVRHLAGYTRRHRLEVLEGAGHLPMRQRPRELAGLIHAWIEEEALAPIPG